MKSLSKKQTSNAHICKPAEQMVTIELITTDRISVPVAFYEKIKASITWVLPFCPHHSYLVPEDLVGPDFWCGLNAEEKRMGRACIAHLSQTRVLPISPRDSAIDYTEFYVIG